MSAFEFEGHEALIAQLRGGMLAAPDYLHQRVLAGAPGRPARSARPARAPRSRQRKIFTVVAFAAVLAVGAAVVQATFSSGSKPVARAPFSHGPARGLRGANGLTGANGSTGHNGATGMQGATGAAGPTGAEGATGANGATGAEGATGAKGPTGAAGATGVNGERRRSSVHGVNGADGATGMKGPAGMAAPTGAQGAAGPAGPPGPTGGTGATGASFGAEQEAAPAALNDKTLEAVKGNPAVSIPSNRLVHAVALLQVAVANHKALTQATNDARQIVTRLGGYAQSVQYVFSNTGNGGANLTLHVPLSKTETALTELGQLGELTYQRISTQDLVRKFTRQTSTIGKLRRQIAVYEQALQSGTLSSSQRVDVQLRLANARRALKGTRKARIHTVASGHTSDIQLSLTTRKQHRAAAAPHKTGRLGQMLHNIGNFLAVEALVVLYILIVGLPIILIVGLVWWFTLGRKRRDEKRLLASEA